MQSETRKTFSVIGEASTDKTIDQIAEEIEQLAHDLRTSAAASTMANHAETIMHLAADIILTITTQKNPIHEKDKAQ